MKPIFENSPKKLIFLHFKAIYHIKAIYNEFFELYWVFKSFLKQFLAKIQKIFSNINAIKPKNLTYTPHFSKLFVTGTLLFRFSLSNNANSPLHIHFRSTSGALKKVFFPQNLKIFGNKNAIKLKNLVYTPNFSKLFVTGTFLLRFTLNITLNNLE